MKSPPLNDCFYKIFIQFSVTWDRFPNTVFLINIMGSTVSF